MDEIASNESVDPAEPLVNRRRIARWAAGVGAGAVVLAPVPAAAAGTPDKAVARLVNRKGTRTRRAVVGVIEQRLVSFRARKLPIALGQEAADGVSPLRAALDKVYASPAAGGGNAPVRAASGIPRAVASSVVSLFAENWAPGPDGTAVADTVETVRGTRSLRVTTAGAGAAGYGCFGSLTRAPVDMTNKNLRVTLKCDDISRLNRIHLLVGDAGFANHITYTLQQEERSSNFIESGEWVSITIPWASVAPLDITGAPPRSAITNFRVRVVDNGAPVKVWFQAIELVDPVATYPNGVVSLCFDDGPASTWSRARPVLDARGVAGTSYVVADWVNTSGYMTTEQLRSLQDNAGWEVAGHAATEAAHSAQRGYLALSRTALDSELASLRTWLDDEGFTSRGFAYPQGYFSREVADRVGRQFAYARTIVGATQETLRPADPLKIRSMSGISSYSGGTSVASLTAAGGHLDQVKAAPGWLVLTFHEIVAGAPTTALECSAGDLADLIDACADRGIPVLPVGRVLEYLR